MNFFATWRTRLKVFGLSRDNCFHCGKRAFVWNLHPHPDDDVWDVVCGDCWKHLNKKNRK